MRLTFAGLLLFAPVALGQTVTFQTSVAEENNLIVVSKAECELDRTVTWTRTGTLCDKLNIWLSNADCSGEPGADDLLLAEISTTSPTTQGTVTFNAADALTKGGLVCAEQTANKSFKLCATTKRASTTTTGCDTAIASIGTPTYELRLDPVPPPAPGTPSVTGLDKALSVSVDAPGDADLIQVHVFAQVTGGDGGVEPGDSIASKEQTADNTDFRVEGLENDVKYYVRARAVDAAGNVGDFSEAVEGTPVGSRGIFDEYVRAGGKETGGCGAGGGGLAGGAVLAALGFWLSRRKQS
ncbi:MAG TPA: MXAN_2561 family MXYO-CTERM-anchored protein [Myxococcus sp.]|nr:MXAN_2561 family MXYO-CTERM-anchored protein [Myxococcus sp.]